MPRGRVWRLVEGNETVFASDDLDEVYRFLEKKTGREAIDPDDNVRWF